MRRYVCSWGTSRVDITSFSGRSVKLRRQVEGQHPHNATAEYRRSPHYLARSSTTLFSPPFPRHIVPSSSRRLSVSPFLPTCWPSRWNIRGNSNNADKLASHECWLLVTETRLKTSNGTSIAWLASIYFLQSFSFLWNINHGVRRKIRTLNRLCYRRIA